MSQDEASGCPIGCATIFGTILLALLLPLMSMGCWARIDTEQELDAIRGFDIFLGMMATVAFLLIRPRTKSVRTTFILTIFVFAGVSGFLLGWHEMQVRIRWSSPPRHLAANQVLITLHALEDYRKDCGGLPSEKERLSALVVNPGVAGWAGPYLLSEDLVDPWQNSLQYQVRDNQAEVWSNGPDGQSDSDDDIKFPD